MKNLLVLTYWSFNDPLIQTYTLPYLRIISDKLPKGSSIFVLCLEQKEYKGDIEETKKKIALLEKNGIFFIRKKYFPFGIVAILANILTTLQLSILLIRSKIDTIHCWCTPPAILGLLLAILWNKKLILDSFEPHAESMIENNNWLKKSLAFKILFYFEKNMTRRADIIIGATQGMLYYAKDKYQYQIKNFFVKPACVDLDKFNYTRSKRKDLIKELGLDGKITMLYVGKFGGIYLDQEVFDYIKVAANYFGFDRFKVLILSNINEEDLHYYCLRSNIDRELIELRYVPHKDIHHYMNLANFAICSVKPIPSKRYCTPIKNGEYWAMGLPVVIPRNISDDSEIIEKHEIGYVWKNQTEAEYIKSCEKIEALLKQVDIKERVRKVACLYRDYEVARNVYQNVYGI